MAEQKKENPEHKNQPDINDMEQAAPDQEASHYDENGQGGQGAPSADAKIKSGKNPIHDIGNERSIDGREDS